MTNDVDRRRQEFRCRSMRLARSACRALAPPRTGAGGPGRTRTCDNTGGGIHTPFTRAPRLRRFNLCLPRHSSGVAKRLKAVRCVRGAPAILNWLDRLSKCSSVGFEWGVAFRLCRHGARALGSIMDWRRWGQSLKTMYAVMVRRCSKKRYRAPRAARAVRQARTQS